MYSPCSISIIWSLKGLIQPSMKVAHRELSKIGLNFFRLGIRRISWGRRVSLLRREEEENWATILIASRKESCRPWASSSLRSARCINSIRHQPVQEAVSIPSSPSSHSRANFRPTLKKKSKGKNRKKTDTIWKDACQIPLYTPEQSLKALSAEAKRQ